METARKRIEKANAWIIEKDRRYLERALIVAGRRNAYPKWTWSRWDAWRTRDEAAAKRVAKTLGATAIRFNPITGDGPLEGGGAA